MDHDVFSFVVKTGKKFGVTEFVNSGNCGDKSVSQVFFLTYIIIVWRLLFNFLLVSILSSLGSEYAFVGIWACASGAPYINMSLDGFIMKHKKGILYSMLFHKLLLKLGCSLCLICSFGFWVGRGKVEKIRTKKFTYPYMFLIYCSLFLSHCAGDK